jgi:microcystin-dependent protein
MSSYSKATNFTTKDTLPSGNSGKIVKGTELDVEFTAIASAVNSKADTDSPTFTGAPITTTASLGTNTTQIASCAFVLSNAVPTGCIVLWSGSTASVPAGWHICDGSNGTPELRNRFILGAGNSYAVGATGGTTDAVVPSHSHTATSNVSDPGHVHGGGSNGGALSVSNVPYYSFAQNSNTASAVTGITVSTSIDYTGVSASGANMPPYYALAYIMKL